MTNENENENEKTPELLSKALRECQDIGVYAKTPELRQAAACMAAIEYHLATVYKNLTEIREIMKREADR